MIVLFFGKMPEQQEGRAEGYKEDKCGNDDAEENTTHGCHPSLCSCGAFYTSNMRG
jgi:hypothetical protein